MVDVITRLANGPRLSRASAIVGPIQVGCTTMGRGPRAACAATRPAANQEGGSDLETVRAAVCRRTRAREPAEAERDCRQGIAASSASAAVPRSQATGRDHERGRAAAESLDGGEVPEDGQQRAGGSQCVAQEGGRVGCDRPDAVYGSAAAYFQVGSDLPRFRPVRTSGRSDEGDRPGIRIDRAPGRRGGLTVRRDDRPRVEGRRRVQAPTLRPTVGLEWRGHIAEGRATALHPVDRCG